MNELFLKIINMSVSASWLVLVVLILRLVLKKAPTWINVLLWGMVAVKLLCPFTIESPFSMIPPSISNGELISEWMDDYIGEVSIIHDNSIYYDAAVTAGREPISDGEGNTYVVTKYDQLGEPSTVENTILPILTTVWASGVVLLALYTAISYWHLHRKIDTAVLYRNNIFQSENVSSPFVLGIIRPKIYLPFNVDKQNLDHIVTHEQAHICRKDHWWKPLGFLLLTLHWFNPLMWLAYALFCRDIELACDEKVIKKLDNEQRADYIQTLVTCSVNRRMIAASPLAFGEIDVKERVKSVMNYKKPTFWIIGLSIISCTAVVACFLTNPSTDKLHAPEPFCHSYRVEEIIYDAPQYSFTYSADTAPRYAFTADYVMYVSGDTLSQTTTEEWVQQYGSFEEVKLTAQNFDDYFKIIDNVSGWQISNATRSKFRNSIEQAWRLDVENSEHNIFYYLILTNSGDIYLTYGYDIGDSHTSAEEVSLIRWLFKLARTDILSCNAISEDCNAYIEPYYYPNGFDWNYENIPVGTINKTGTLVFHADWSTDTLIVSEDYYRNYEDTTHIEKETYTLTKNSEGNFELDVALRGDQIEEAFYFIQAETGVYVMKIIYGTNKIPITDKKTSDKIAFETEMIENGSRFYLTIGAEDVTRIELTMPNSSGGCEHADSSPFKKGERIWLENLDGFTDLRGVTITALNKIGKIVWSASIPDNEENKGFTHLTQDGWTITNIE